MASHTMAAAAGGMMAMADALSMALCVKRAQDAVSVPTKGRGAGRWKGRWRGSVDVLG